MRLILKNQKEYEIAVRWRAFPLHPNTPENGVSLEELFADYPVDREMMMRRLRNTAAELGLPFGERHMTFNSRLAQELGAWAESKKNGDTFQPSGFSHGSFSSTISRWKRSASQEKPLE